MTAHKSTWTPFIKINLLLSIINWGSFEIYFEITVLF